MTLDRGGECFFFSFLFSFLPRAPAFPCVSMDGADDVSMDGSGGLGEEEETLVEFRAGLMRVVGAQLESDPRRGLVRLQRVRD